MICDGCVSCVGDGRGDDGGVGGDNGDLLTYLPQLAVVTSYYLPFVMVH